MSTYTTFRCTIATDGAAFTGENLTPTEELGAMLHRLARGIEDGHTAGTLADSNGNTVGSFSWLVEEK